MSYTPSSQTKQALTLVRRDSQGLIADSIHVFDTGTEIGGSSGGYGLNFIEGGNISIAGNLNSGRYDITIAASVAAVVLNDLSDVVISSPQLNDVLWFDGANWINKPNPTFGPTTIAGGGANPDFLVQGTWNNGATKFDAIKIDISNTGSDPDSTFINAFVGGSTKFWVKATGEMWTNTSISANGAMTAQGTVTGTALATSSNGNLTLGTGNIVSCGDITTKDGGTLKANGTTTGLKIGGATTDKVGFFGVAPVAQQGNTTDLKTVLTNLGFLATGGATPLTTGNGAINTGSGTITSTGAGSFGSLTTTTGGLTILDGQSIVSSATTTGIKLGGASDKLGFFGATAVGKQGNTSDLKDVLVNLGFLTNGGATPLTTDNGAIDVGTSSVTGYNFVVPAASTSLTPISITQTWNNAGNTWKAISLAITNTNSNAASRLIEATVGGSAVFSVEPSGRVNISAPATAVLNPVLDMASIWNSSATLMTSIKLKVTDTASAAGSLLMDLQAGTAGAEATKFSIDKAGNVVIAGNVTPTGYVTKVGNLAVQTNMSGLSDGQVLQWNSSNSRFEPGSAAVTTAGGSNTQFQYNNSGAFGGTTGFTWDSTNQVISHTSASITGTTSYPLYTGAQTWNNSGGTFTGWKMTFTDTASNAASLLLDLWAGSTPATKFSVRKDGFVNAAAGITSGGTVTGTALATSSGGLTIADGQSIVSSATTTGIKIGGASDKLGFFNATPVGKQANTTDLKDVLVNLGFLTGAGATPLVTDNGAINSGSGNITTTGATSTATLSVTSTSTFTGMLTANGGITLTNDASSANTIVAGTTNGLKIGTATTQKIGFFNATPVAQQTNTTDLKTVLTVFGFLASGGATNLTTDNGNLVLGTGNITSCGDITTKDGGTIKANGTTTGLKIGGATTDKVGFFGVAPVAQQGNTTDLKTVLTNLGFLATGGATPLTTGNGAINSGSGTITSTGAGSFGSLTTTTGGLTILDGQSIVSSATTTGIKIGGASDKLGFFNATPVAKQGNTSDLKDVLVNLGFLTDGGATPLVTDNGAINSGSGNITTTGATSTSTLSVTSTSTFTGMLTANGGITLTNDGAAANTIVAGTTNGLKIGTSTTQKIGFFNATPVAQQGNTTDLKTVLTNLGFLATGGATPLTTGNGAINAGTGTITGGGITTTTTFATKSVVKNASYVISTAVETVILVDCLSGTAGSKSVTLPAASGVADRWYIIKKIDTDATYTVTVTPNGTDTIDGVNASITLVAPMEAVSLVCNGSGWYVI